MIQNQNEPMSWLGDDGKKYIIVESEEDRTSGGNVRASIFEILDGHLLFVLIEKAEALNDALAQLKKAGVPIVNSMAEAKRIAGLQSHI